MDNAEKMRRKATWDKMTVSERQKVEQEKSDIIKWSIEEERKAVEKIKAEGRYNGGLDGYYPELVEISEKTKQKLNELLNRVCGQPEDT